MMKECLAADPMKLIVRCSGGIGETPEFLAKEGEG